MTFLRTTASLFLLATGLLAESAGGISWTAPSAWKSQGERPMRAATYMVPPAAGDSEPGECAVFYFGPGQGGGVDANIKRWLGQFKDPPANPAPKSRTANGLKLTTIEHMGTYMAGAPMAPVKTPKPGYRLIGTIIEAPQGNVFFKLTGPAKTVAAAQAGFEKMLAGVKK
ncbi:MAG: hypothetical protein R2762_21465 [Bryobacteraceae bacterium]